MITVVFIYNSRSKIITRPNIGIGTMLVHNNVHNIYLVEYETSYTF